MKHTLPAVAFLPISLLTEVNADGEAAMLDGAASAVTLLERNRVQVTVYLEKIPSVPQRINAIMHRLGSVRIMNATPLELAETGGLIVVSSKEVKNSLQDSKAVVIHAEPATRNNYCDLLAQVESRLSE